MSRDREIVVEGPGCLDDFSPVVRGDRLQFTRLEDDEEENPQVVRWRALYDDPGAPASPHFALDVKLARGSDAADDQNRFDKLVGEVCAGFRLTAEDGGTAGEDPEAGDDGALGPLDVAFRPILLDHNVDCGDRFNFSAVVERHLPGLPLLEGHLLEKGADRWKSMGGFSGDIEVKVTSGSATLITSPTESQPVSAPMTISHLAGSSLRVETDNILGCDYVFIGNFRIL